jgi:hypothetical protein
MADMLHALMKRGIHRTNVLLMYFEKSFEQKQFKHTAKVHYKEVKPSANGWSAKVDEKSSQTQSISSIL